MNPEATVLSYDGRDRLRVRLVGGDIASEWAPRVPRLPWCDLTLLLRQGRLTETSIASFGGEVWPAAWPELFTSHRGTAQTGSYTLITYDGLALLERALIRAQAEAVAS